MNRFMQENWSWVEALHALRAGVLDTLTDADLAFNPGGANVTFGQLYVGLGEIEHSYISSLETFKQDWSFRNSNPDLATSVATIKGWFHELDGRLEATVTAFSDDDLKTQVERSGGSSMPVELQVQVYMQSVFIFLGKAVVYLRSMNRPLPPTLEEYIG
jgi:hypothetical protein